MLTTVQHLSSPIPENLWIDPTTTSNLQFSISKYSQINYRASSKCIIKFLVVWLWGNPICVNSKPFSTYVSKNKYSVYFSSIFGNTLDVERKTDRVVDRRKHGALLVKYFNFGREGQALFGPTSQMTRLTNDFSAWDATTFIFAKQDSFSETAISCSKYKNRGEPFP